jgi:regulator of replication initiation timing
MNHVDHSMFVIQERIKRIMVEFEALKEAVPKLIQALKDERANNAQLRQQIANPPAPDPAPEDVAALTTEITDVLNTPAAAATPAP